MLPPRIVRENSKEFVVKKKKKKKKVREGESRKKTTTGVVTLNMYTLGPQFPLPLGI